MTIECLADLINDIGWDDFRNIDSGDLWVHSPSFFDDLKPVRFCMRIGLHLRRPMEVVIAKDQFVRMRYSKEFEGFELNRLDAERPDACIYFGDSQNPNVLSPQAFVHQAWRPKYPKGYHEQQKQLQLAQMQAQAQVQSGIHGLQGYGGGAGGAGSCTGGIGGGGGASYHGTVYAGVPQQVHPNPLANTSGLFGNSLGAMVRSLGNLFSYNLSVKI